MTAAIENVVCRDLLFFFFFLTSAHPSEDGTLNWISWVNAALPLVLCKEAVNFKGARSLRMIPVRSDQERGWRGGECEGNTVTITTRVVMQSSTSRSYSIFLANDAQQITWGNMGWKGWNLLTDSLQWQTLEEGSLPRGEFGKVAMVWLTVMNYFLFRKSQSSEAELGFPNGAGRCVFAVLFRGSLVRGVSVSCVS